MNLNEPKEIGFFFNLFVTPIVNLKVAPDTDAGYIIMAKTISTPKVAPANPWLGVNWKQTVAPCDASIITPSYCHAKKIDIQNLPEPFSGYFDSKVVCLNLNPGCGECDACFYGDPTLLKLTQNTLKHNTVDCLWDTPLMCKHGLMHDGYVWSQNRTKELRCSVCPNPLELFYLEFFPYHTKKAFAYPKNLPSNEYRNWLLCQAMKNNKLIVLLRGRKQWFGIKDKCCDGQPLGEKLENYENLIIHKNPRNVYLTEINFDSDGWKKLINALK